MSELRPVTVLYTMPKSVYLDMEGVDCWDKCIGVRRKPHMLPEISRRGRRATPPGLAEWLVAVARLAETPKGNDDGK